MTTTNSIIGLKKPQNMLRLTYGLVPIAAGTDKFLNILTDWENYLAPSLADLLPFSASVFMMIIGIVEIIAGILVLTKTATGAYIVSAWLLLISLSLLLTWHHPDVAVRDIVMAIGAYALAQLTILLNSNAK